MSPATAYCAKRGRPRGKVDVAVISNT